MLRKYFDGLLIAWLLAATCLFVVPALRATGLQFSTPLDDAFIHFVYARNFAQGRIFVWSQDSGYSTGATSALYPLLLAAGWRLGFRDHWLMLCALLINVAGFGACLLISRRIAARRTSPFYACLAPLLIGANGIILFLVFSGMEYGLCLGMLALCLYWIECDWHSGTTGAFRRRTIVLAMLVPLARPDWTLFIGVPVLFFVLARVRQRNYAAMLQAACVLLPLAGWLCLNRIMTGFFTPNTLAAKSLRSIPYLSREEKLQMFRSNLTDPVFSMLNRIYPSAIWPALIVTLGLLSGIVCVALLRARQLTLNAIVFDLALLLGALLGISFNATLDVPTVDNFRFYLGPLTLLILFGIRFSGYLFHPQVAQSSVFVPWQKRLLAGGIIVAGLCLCLLTPGSVIKQFEPYQRAWRGNFWSHIHLARYINQRGRETPIFKGKIITHDAGMLPYFSQNNYYDMVGLCTNPGFRLAEYWLNDPNCVFEAIERDPPALWPDLAVVFEKYRYFPLVGERLATETEIWSAADSAVYPDLRPTRFEKLGIFAFRKELLLTGHAPVPRLLPENWSIVDRIDLADVRDEQQHAFRQDWTSVTLKMISVFKVAEHDGRKIADCGRYLTPAIEWRMKVKAADQPAILWARMITTRDASLEIKVDRQPAISLVIPADNDLKVHQLLRLPECDGAELRIKIGTSRGAAALFHAWLLQPELQTARPDPAE